MIFTYEKFVNKLNDRIKTDQNFINNLLITIISNPNRYTGVFRLSNAKTKLVQNVTQSREIKFGDFMEDIVTDYISEMGYINLDKNIGFDEEGNALSADQIFELNDTVYLIEQKIRDDHDSTKKRGQYSNFKKKYILLKNSNPQKKVIACMWFIDKSLRKNKKYYITEASKEKVEDVKIYILYGETLFAELFNRIDIWNEIVNYLNRNKNERNSELLNIPDFDTSEEIFEALKYLKELSKLDSAILKNLGYSSNIKSLYNKLISDDDTYVQLRKELFPTEFNINRIKKFDVKERI